MVLGPGNNDIQGKPVSDSILDVDGDSITNPQESTHTVLLGVGLQHVGASRRNSTVREARGELESLRELDRDLRAEKPDGSRQTFNNENTLVAPVSVVPSTIEVPYEESHEHRLSMAGTFTVNVYSTESAESLPPSDEMEFGKAKTRRSRGSSAYESTEGAGVGYAYSPYTVLPPIGTHLNLSDDEDRASLVNAVPLYDRKALDGMLSMDKYGAHAVSNEPETQMVEQDDALPTHSSPEQNVPLHTSELPPSNQSEEDNSQLRFILQNRRYTEPLPQITRHKMETTSLPNSVLSEHSSSPKLLEAKFGKLPKIPTKQEQVNYDNGVTDSEGQTFADSDVFSVANSDWNNTPDDNTPVASTKTKHVVIDDERYPITNADSYIVTDSKIFVAPKHQDKASSVNFSELIQFEGQITGQYFQSLEEYLDLAADVAVADMVKIHTYNGYLIKSDSIRFSLNDSTSLFHEHPADRIVLSAVSADCACQCNLAESSVISDSAPIEELVVLENHPSSDLVRSTKFADSAVHCDLMSHKDKMRSGLNPKLIAKQEPSNMEQEGKKNHSTVCTLPHPVPPTARRPLHKLSDLVESYVKDVFDSSITPFNLSQDIHGKFKSHLVSIITSSLRLMVSANGRSVTEHQLVQWLRTTNLLSILEVLLVDTVAVAIQTYKHNYALNIDHLIYPEVQAREPTAQVCGAFQMVAPRMEANKKSDSSPSRRDSGSRRASRLNDSLLMLLQDNFADIEKLLLSDASSPKESGATSASGSLLTEVPDSVPGGKSLNWKFAARRLLKKKRKQLTSLLKKRMTFLNKLFEDMSKDERSFLRNMFAAANPSRSGYISVTEMSTLLSTATGAKFSIANCRKIMADVDLDEDGNLSETDILAILYLSELYLIALSDGFRCIKLAEMAKLFTASHALVFIALSQLCHSLKLKLTEERNIFLLITNLTPDDQRNKFINQTQLPLDSVPILFCMSLMGQQASFYDAIWLKLVEVTKVKMGDSRTSWQSSEFISPTYKRNSGALVFPVINKQMSRYPRMPYLVRKNCALARDPIPPIHIRGPNIDFDPLSIYSNAGIGMFHRKKTTSYGIESTSRRPASIISLREIRKLAARQLGIAQIFLETVLFDSRKHREIVSVFSSNRLKAWPQDPLPPPKPTHKHEANVLEDKFPDRTFDIHNVLEMLKERMKEQRDDTLQ